MIKDNKDCKLVQSTNLKTNAQDKTPIAELSSNQLPDQTKSRTLQNLRDLNTK